MLHWQNFSSSASTSSNGQPINTYISISPHISLAARVLRRLSFLTRHLQHISSHSTTHCNSQSATQSNSSQFISHSVTQCNSQPVSHPVSQCNSQPAPLSQSVTQSTTALYTSISPPVASLSVRNTVSQSVSPQGYVSYMGIALCACSAQMIITYG